MFTVHRNVLIDFPSWDNPLFSIVVLATPYHPCHPLCGETADISRLREKKRGDSWIGMYSSIWGVAGSSPHFDVVERPESIFYDLPTSATLTLCEARSPYPSPITPQETLKGTYLSIGLCNWNSKQLVQRLSSLGTSTYFIMRLDSFIMRAVWLIFAPWCPPNV